MRKRKIADGAVFDAVNGAALFLVLIVVLYPLIYILSASFSEPEMVFNGSMWLLPKGFTLIGYERILEYREIWMGYANTIFYTVAGTILNLLVTLPGAYALSRRDMKGRNFVTALLLVTMYVSGGMIPSYLLMKDLKLIDSRM